MSSFINKFLGFVKNIVAGRKKESPEPEIIRESETQPSQEIVHEEEIPEQEMIPEPELQEPEPEVIPEPEQTDTESELEPELELEVQAELSEPESEIQAELPTPEPEQADIEPEPELEIQVELPEPESEIQAELPVAEPEQTDIESEPELEIQTELPESESETPAIEPESELHTELPAPEPERKDEYDYTQIMHAIRNIITQHYGYYGFNIADTKGYERFRTYAKNYEILLPESDNELRRLIVRSGTLIDGTIYVFDSEDVKMMLCEVQRLIDKGVNVIYFRELESFIEESNQYHNLNSRRAVREILMDSYDGCTFTELYMETSSGPKKFRSYMDGLKYVLSKYFPDGFNADYALLREYAAKENIILSGNDKALKRETDALLMK